MKRWLPVISIGLLAIGCGKNPAQSVGDQVGSYRDAVLSQVDSSVQSTAMSLCQVLSDKSSNFQLYQLGSTFNFKTTKTVCDGSQAASDVAAKLVLNGSRLEYSIQSGSNFVTQVETSTVGLISSVCKTVGTLTNPVMASSTTAVWFEVYSGPSSCSNNSNVRCVKLETGYKQDDGRYLVNTVDVFQVDYSAGPLTGMVLRHDNYTGGCTNGKQNQLTSTFVSKQ